MKGQQRAVLGLVAVLPIVFLCWTATETDSWRFFFSDTHEIRYTDLRPITANVSCSISDPGWSVEGPSCDPWGRILNYPRIWLSIFRFLGLDDSHAILAGVMVSVLLVIGLGVIAYLSIGSISAALIGAVLFISPPVMFVAERGNIDAVIFFMLALAAIGLTHDKSWIRWLGGVLVYLAAILKLFPLGAVVAWFLVPKRDRIRPARVLSTMTVGAISIGLYLQPEMPRILNNTPSFPAMQFGVRAIPAETMYCIPNGVTYGYCEWGRRPEIALGFSFILGLTVLVAILDRISPYIANARVTFLNSLADNKFGISSFLVFGGTYVTAFLFGNAWYYRLIFLIPIMMFSYGTRSSLGYGIVVLGSLTLFLLAGNVLYLLLAGQLFATLLCVLLVYLLIHITRTQWTGRSGRVETPEGRQQDVLD